MLNVLNISPTEKTQLDNILIISDDLAESVELSKHFFKSNFKESFLLYLGYKTGLSESWEYVPFCTLN